MPVLLLIILTSSLPYWPCQKSEWAKPGNLVTKLCSSSIPRNKISPTSPTTFHFHLLFSHTFHLSLQSSFEELNVCFFSSEQQLHVTALSTHTWWSRVPWRGSRRRFMVSQSWDTLLPEISRLRPEICRGMSLGLLDQGCTSSEHSTYSPRNWTNCT